MKRPLLKLALLLCAVSALNAQADLTLVSGHYTIRFPASFTGAEPAAETFNAYWAAFNEFFRFNPDTGMHTNRVVILEDKVAFDTYITARIGEKRSEYIFLKYPKPELSELVLYLVPGAMSDSPALAGFAFTGPSLGRQLFLQYLYSYVSEPPLWIRDGFQAWFEKTYYDPVTKTFHAGGYSVWLDAAKNLRADPGRALGSYDILSAVTGSRESTQFYPQAWAFVSFLLNTEKMEYQRFLSEAFILLEGDGPYNGETQQENTDLIKNRFARFNDAGKTDTDFGLWLSGQFTFAELIQAGVSAYNAGKYADAKRYLAEALDISPADPMISYYSGLVSYAEKDWASAALWYGKALRNGADASTVNWALGLNAYADKKYAAARVYLETAKAANPARYAEKADKLIRSMPK